MWWKRNDCCRSSQANGALSAMEKMRQGINYAEGLEFPTPPELTLSLEARAPNLNNWMMSLDTRSVLVQDRNGRF